MKFTTHSRIRRARQLSATILMMRVLQRIGSKIWNLSDKPSIKSFLSTLAARVA
jgi:hypothetical protein